jgi:hypothetical protein
VKGISSAAAAVIVATITITLVGTTYFFTQSLMGGATAETFEIIDMFENRVIVRSTGTEPIEEFKSLLDGNEVSNYIESPPIQPGKVGTVVLDTDIEQGRHMLTLISQSMSQTWQLLIKAEVGGTGATGVSGILGDLNDDGFVNYKDLDMVKNTAGYKPGQSKWNSVTDVVGDNEVNVLDLIFVSTHCTEDYCGM